MFSKKTFMSASWVIGMVFAVSIFMGLPGGIAMADDGAWDLCGNNDEFTRDFRLEDCKFKTTGENPFFILRPGYRIVLETPEDEEEREKSVETVLEETKQITLDGRRIRTRVLEERAFEWEDGEGGYWKTIEISRNYFAICKKTNAVFYFGEWSRDCESGFDEDDFCENENNDGSWEAGVDGALPGLMMPGTALLGAKYFQEIAPPDAVDRGEIAGMGLDWPLGDPEEAENENEEEDEEFDFSDCILIFDTNPAEGECGEDDSKIYCPGVGLVQDQDLELISYGYVEEDDDDVEDDVEE